MFSRSIIIHFLSMGSTSRFFNVIMQFRALLLTTLAFAVFSCEGRVNSVTSGGLDVPGVKMAICGSEGGDLVFVVLPTFDWTEGCGVGGSESGAGGGLDSSGAYWTGHHQDTKNHRWQFEVRNGEARFGQQMFSLAKGEVFIMREDFSIEQIPGSKAGRKGDKQNLERLSTLYREATGRHESHKQERLEHY